MPDDDLRPAATSHLFDEVWYAARYPDVALSGWSPRDHYRRIGARLGRDPGPSFSTAAYLRAHPEAATSGLDALAHFERFGRLDQGMAIGLGGLGAATSRRADAGLSVDIVVPVHDALEDVQACLRSLARVPTRVRFRVLVVNDGSSAPTTDWLRQAIGSLDGAMATFTLREHEANRGYTVAVNTGLRASRAPYVVTLNSDTIVTPFWLDGLLRCMRSDPAIGIVGPLSNAASWQNVPRLHAEDGGFAINLLPPGIDPAAMAALVARASIRQYPRTPFLNGFCYMICRKVIERIGTMDETAFPTGYGEENDYSIRAQDAGFALAIADDTYVHHAKSRSFGTERRIELSRKGSDALKAKHPPERLAALMAQVRDTRAMDAVRSRVRAALDETLNPTARLPRDWVFTQKVLFILQSSSPSGGGVHSVVQEAAAMRRMGVEAKVALRAEHMDRFLRGYSEIPAIEDLFVAYTPTDLMVTASRFDVVVATIFSSVRMLAQLAETCPWILPAYYVQDYEPLFFEPGSDPWQEASASYELIPGALLFAKTDWIRREVEARHGVAVHKVRPSIDHEVYRPSAAAPPAGDRVCIVAMVRPKTPRRGAGRTMDLLKRLKGFYGDRVAIRIFGGDSDSAEFQALTRDFEFENLGVLARPQVASVLQEADVFLDLSDYQAFGRTALEAMACGTFALVPSLGGSDEYAVDGVNALVVDSQDVEACFDRLVEVLGDAGRVSDLRMAALATATTYSPRQAALSELMTFAAPLARLREAHRRPRRTRLTLLPALTADKGKSRSVTGLGYVRLVQPYSQYALTPRVDLTVSLDGLLPEPGSADLVVLQRDLSPEAWPVFEPWHRRFRQLGGRMIYEIDDDLLDAEGLRARGYARDPKALAERVLTYAGKADLITVSTPRIAARFAHLADKVRIVPNYIDDRLWCLEARVADPKVVRPKPEGQVRIGYMGTPSHYPDMRVVQEAMLRLQERHGDALDIEVIGAFQDQEPLFGTRLGLPRKNSYPSFVAWVRSVTDWDIAIIPLADDPFNLSKSNLKFLESATLKLGIVCSDVPAYADVARDGENCLLVPNTTEAWVEALTRLIEDPDLRGRLGEAAHRDVRLGLTVQKRRDDYLSLLERALDAGP